MQLTDNPLQDLWFNDIDHEQAFFQAGGSASAALAEMQGIKPFSAIHQRVLACLESDDFEIADIAKMIEADPVLASTVLRAANSSMYGTLIASQTVAQAVIRLGRITLQEIIISLGMAGFFHDNSGVGALVRDHCVGTAAIARVMALEFAPESSELIFLAGLLHDLGKLLLLQSGEINYQDMFSNEEIMRSDNLHLIERERLGFDHALLAGHVLSHWKILEPVPQIVAWHHNPEQAYQRHELGSMVAVLRLANLIEPHLKTQPEQYGELVDKFCRGSEVKLLEISKEQLLNQWEMLFFARNEALDIFR